MTDTEKLISALGGRGRFQNTVHLLAGFGGYVPLCFNHVIMAFHGSSIPHKCMAGDDINIGSNSTYSSPKVQPQVTNVSHSQCFTTVTYSDGQEKVIECTSGQWEYFPQYGERNIVTQFDLVCSAEYLTNLATTIYFTGVMVGGLVFGDLADRFGRRLSMLFTMYAALVISLASAFSVNYTMFVCLRFLLGILQQGLQNAVYTLVIELFQPQHRPYAGVVVELFFSSSIMVLAGLAYGLRYWRHLQITVALIPLVTVFYPWVIPESLRWLVMKGKMEKAEKQIQRICKTNKVSFPHEVWSSAKKSKGSQAVETQQYNMTHLFRTWPLMKITLISIYLWYKITLISIYLWVTIASTYYGLTFKVTSLKGNPYLNFFISGLLEVTMAALCLPIMNRFGRKKPIVVGFILCSTLCLTSGFLNSYTTGLDKLVTAFGLVGKCAGSCIFIIFFVYTTELYPTVVRNVGLGLGMFWARLGGVMAPQINQWTSVLFGFDVIYLFGTLSLIGGLIVLPLPETHQRRLPDTIEEEITVQAEATGLMDKLEMDDTTTETLGTQQMSEKV
ncbi:hypothetical protein RRG08_011442 [Elysia crispata]|uniref:Major facilitator superfamily (MFS) profile domain-containing protein n=1 Tax=Elysia crispata TaxID=231223 RepID=A0AAE0ZV39_9GAST|nr:hypothetical protein RRG08_011442 [Elysia crispata]